MKCIAHAKVEANPVIVLFGHMVDRVKDNLKTLLTNALNPQVREDVYDSDKNPFAESLLTERNNVVEKRLNKWKEKNLGAATAAVDAERKRLGEEFDKNDLKAAKEKRLKFWEDTYDNKNDATTAKIDGIVSNAATDGIGGAFNGKGFFGGMMESLKNSVSSFVLSIPMVGDFLGQLTTFVRSQVASWSPNAGEALGWTEAGEAYQKDKIVSRLTTQLKPIANEDKLKELLDKAMVAAAKKETIPLANEPVQDPNKKPELNPQADAQTREAAKGLPKPVDQKGDPQPQPPIAPVPPTAPNASPPR